MLDGSQASGILRRQFAWLLLSFPEQYRSAVTQRYTGWKATLTADPHNQYLLILAETGLLGLTVFAWFLFSALRQQVRGSFGVVGIALLLAWSLTSLFSSHFHTFNEGPLDRDPARSVPGAKTRHPKSHG